MFFDNHRPDNRLGQRVIFILIIGMLIFSLVMPLPVDAKRKKRRRRATSSGGGGGGVVLKTPTPRNPLEHNNRGVELGSKGLWADAIREHEIALNGDPYNKQFRMNLSAAHLRFADRLAAKKKWYEAITHYREALYADPNNLPADQHLRDCIGHLGKNPDDYATRQKMAEDADVSQNYPVAVVEYRICVKMRDDGLSHYNLAACLFKMNKIVEAYEELRIAINKPWTKEQRNDMASAHRLMGDILWDVALKAKQQGRGKIYLKRLSNVGVCYRRAVTINPLDTNAVRGLVNASREALAVQDTFHNNLMIAGAYLLAGDFERARMHYAKCWKIQPGNPVLHKARQNFHLAVVSSPISSPALKQNSVMKIQKQLEKQPDNPELLYIYGKGKEELKDTDTALLAYRKAYLINPFANPDLGPAIERLTGIDPGTKTASQTEADQAEQDAKDGKKVAKKPPKPAIDPSVLEAIKTKIAEGDLAHAEEDLLNLVQKFPKAGELWLLMGGIKEQQGEMAAAKVAYRQARVLKAPGAEDASKATDASRIKPLLDKGTEHLRQGDYVKAAASFKQAIQLAPELPEPHRKLAEVLDKLGDKKTAEKERKKADELEKKE